MKTRGPRACIAHLSFDEKHTSRLKSVTCKSGEKLKTLSTSCMSTNQKQGIHTGFQSA